MIICTENMKKSRKKDSNYGRKCVVSLDSMGVTNGNALVSSGYYNEIPQTRELKQ